ncbi:hypothetical protein NPIL_419941 [Nephila pilipes]|uniref:Uncharacterized protein n=1 Tax=Nephila pilipes TaxID=299642 RepID=A0A8X6JTI6_NEPPI|nr:hypothetical protein NPIL_419941 [Nephila pilipes]
MHSRWLRLQSSYSPSPWTSEMIEGLRYFKPLPGKSFIYFSKAYYNLGAGQRPRRRYARPKKFVFLKEGASCKSRLSKGLNPNRRAAQRWVYWELEFS